MPTFNIDVVLTVVSRDFHCPKVPLILVCDDTLFSLPNAPLGEQESTLEVAARLLQEHTGFPARIRGVGWIDLVPAPVADSPHRRLDGVRRIAVPYGTMIPAEHAPPKQPGLRWVPLNEAVQADFEGDHKEIMLACIHLV